VIGRLLRQRWLRLRATRCEPHVTAFIALMLAVLNPLACLIHCAAMDLMSQSHAQHTMRAGGYTYVCGMPWLPTQPQAAAAPARLQIPTPALDTLPRAVYESILTTSYAVGLFLLLVAFLRSHATLFCSSYAPPPFTPPRTA